MSDIEKVVEVRNLVKWFPLASGFFETLLSGKQSYVRAVDDISFDICNKDIFVLAGESGCGKTTTGKTIIGLLEPTEGSVYYKGTDIFPKGEKDLKEIRKIMQIIFQDPYESLNPRLSIYETIAEPLRIHKICSSKEEEQEMVSQSLETVHLAPPAEFTFRYPHELSGGQRQRVAVARALILGPEFIVADEPVSMLDVSIRSEILKLLLDLREKYDITYLYITHDLAIASYIGNKIAIMYLGKIVEQGSMESVINSPLHPYTKALISAIPSSDPTMKKRRIMITGEPPSPVSPPTGCRFHSRCPVVMEMCHTKEPALVDLGDGHYVACYKYI